jgi:hypothetical protein
MARLTIEISEDLLIRLKAYAKAENFETAKHNKLFNRNYSTDRTYKDIAEVILRCETENGAVHFTDDDEVMDIFKQEIARLSKSKTPFLDKLESSRK